MSDDWLEIPDENIDAEEIMRRIRERMMCRGAATPSDQAESPEVIVEALWREAFGDTAGSSAFDKRVSIWQRECDIVPRHYVIGWRMPILGPIHALVRRIVNAEIRRYLLSALQKQSTFNLEILQMLQELAQENERLHQEVEELRRTQG